MQQMPVKIDTDITLCKNKTYVQIKFSENTQIKFGGDASLFNL